MGTKTDVQDINWWANLVGGLLDKGEWTTLLFTLAIAFCATYILKIVYFSFFYSNPKSPMHIRLIAVTSGFIAAYLMWNNNAVSMNWYTAGILIGPLSIFLHHVLEGISKMKVVSAIAPWLYPLIKGQHEQRKGKRR